MHRVGLFASEGRGCVRECKETAAGSPWPQLIQALAPGASDSRLREAPSSLPPWRGDVQGPRVLLPDAEVAKRLHESWEQRFGCCSLC